MLSVKHKLSSKSGASMIMAMVFLLFCLLIGGSVYTTATANGSRIENMTTNQQEYYSQRSAMMLMADLLTDSKGQELQVLVSDVTVEQTGASTVHTISISCPNLPSSASFLQKILMEVVIASYQQEGVTLKDSFNWNPDTQHLASASGDIYIACSVDRKSDLKFDDYLKVNYKINAPGSNNEGNASNKDYSMELDFGENQSHFVLTMDGSVNTGTPKTVTVGNMKTTTTTTVIRWSLPDIQKAQYTAENQMGGN